MEAADQDQVEPEAPLLRDTRDTESQKDMDRSPQNICQIMVDTLDGEEKIDHHYPESRPLSGESLLTEVHIQIPSANTDCVADSMFFRQSRSGKNSREVSARK
jgi:hypothetical protein